MGKEQLIAAAVAEIGMPKAEVARALSGLLRAAEKALAAGEEVRISGFGTLLVRNRTARKGRDVRTGAEIEIPARRTVAFRPGKGLLEAVRGGA